MDTHTQHHQWSRMPVRMDWKSCVSLLNRGLQFCGTRTLSRKVKSAFVLGHRSDPF